MRVREAMPPLPPCESLAVPYTAGEEQVRLNEREGVVTNVCDEEELVRRNAARLGSVRGAVKMDVDCLREAGSSVSFSSSDALLAAG